VPCDVIELLPSPESLQWRGLGTYSSCSQDRIEPGEDSWSVVGASWLSSRRRASGDKTTWPQRTEDYQQNGYQNHLTNVLLVSKPRPLKSYSLGLQNRGLRRSIGTSGALEQSFHAKTLRQAARWILILERHGTEGRSKHHPPVIR
jgi:hypothetical protein